MEIDGIFHLLLRWLRGFRRFSGDLVGFPRKMWEITGKSGRLRRALDWNLVDFPRKFLWNPRRIVGFSLFTLISSNIPHQSRFFFCRCQKLSSFSAPFISISTTTPQRTVIKILLSEKNPNEKFLIIHSQISRLREKRSVSVCWAYSDMRERN